MLIAATGVLYIALFALATAQPQHGRALVNRDLSITRGQQVRRVGWVLLAASVSLALSSRSPVNAGLTWIGLFPVAGLPLILARTYHPAIARLGVIVAIGLLLWAIV